MSSNEYQWSISSKNRIKILLALKERKITPTTVSKETNIRINNTSKYLKQLRNKNLIKCLFPEAKKGRLYKLTEKGEKVAKKLKKENLHNKMEKNNHICQIYDDNNGKDQKLPKIIKNYIADDYKLIYLTNENGENKLTKNEMENGGPRELLKTKRMEFKNRVPKVKEETKKILNLLNREEKRALENGYSGLKAIIDMKPIRNHFNYNEILEYEENLDNFIIGSNIGSICQYGKEDYNFEEILNIISKHPNFLINGSDEIKSKNQFFSEN